MICCHSNTSSSYNIKDTLPKILYPMSQLFKNETIPKFNKEILNQMNINLKIAKNRIKYNIIKFKIKIIPNKMFEHNINQSIRKYKIVIYFKFIISHTNFIHKHQQTILIK